jgi:hypothetical protein
MQRHTFLAMIVILPTIMFSLHAAELTARREDADEARASRGPVPINDPAFQAVPVNTFIRVGPDILKTPPLGIFAHNIFLVGRGVLLMVR